MTTPVLHPRSVAAVRASAEAHELAAAVLRRRNPSASKEHADLAVRLRVKAAPVDGGRRTVPAPGAVVPR